jgi:predicted GNAT family N-acyltransferase
MAPNRHRTQGVHRSMAIKQELIIELESGSALLPAVFDLRREVFCAEQGVPVELELDQLDQCAIHLAALLGEDVVGTLRILDHGRAAKIGRVAVRATARRSGIASRMMERACAIARQRGFAEIVLHAQVEVAGFYRRLGYVEEGDVFDEAGIAHVAMRRKLG